MTSNPPRSYQNPQSQSLPRANIRESSFWPYQGNLVSAQRSTQQLPPAWQHFQYQDYRPRTMAHMNPNEMEEFQHLSDRYQANLPGPLISEKLPISALVTEYAHADSAYIVKTTMLSQTHSGYRAIKGDGQCGWRGTVFAYFEMLDGLDDPSVLEQEIVRLRSFEDTMKMVGIDYDMIVDMFDHTWELLDEIKQALENGIRDESVVSNFMNDENQSNSVVYHFKMMTSAYMQLHADQYEPFLEMPVDQYRVMRIDPTNQEIDQIGLQALTDAVITPAGFGLEVLYLDRSMGEEVTPHQFSSNNVNCPIIRLLYRPGHYDLIYRAGQQAVQVFLQAHHDIGQDMTMSYQPNESSDLQRFLFPDVGSSNPGTNVPSFMGLGHSSSPEHQYFAHPETTWNMPAHSYPGVPGQSTPVPHVHMGTGPAHFSESPVPITPVQHHHGNTLPQDHAPVTTNRGGSKHRSSTSPTINEPQIRLTANCFNLRHHPSVPLTPVVQSAATLSTAHFQNQDFQPQMWNANEEYCTKREQ